MTETPDWEGFGRAIMEEWQEHCEIDASDKFDLAIKFHILREIEGGFDPERHIDCYGSVEAGDPWYEMNATPAREAAEDLVEALREMTQLAIQLGAIDLETKDAIALYEKARGQS